MKIEFYTTCAHPFFVCSLPAQVCFIAADIDGCEELKTRVYPLLVERVGHADYGRDSKEKNGMNISRSPGICVRVVYTLHDGF